MAKRSRASSARGRTRKRRRPRRAAARAAAAASPLGHSYRGRASLGGVPLGDDMDVVVMGVVNVSPESFHPGSVYVGAERLMRAAVGMVEAGASIIDVGARSTAPYLRTA